MHIELTEFLRCPEPHPEAFCILVPVEMTGRDVVQGVIGCSGCRREYPIERGVARFGELPAAEAQPAAMPDGPDPVSAEGMQALLGLTGPGGYVVLVGSLARLAEPLAPLIKGTHVVAVNAPPAVATSSAVSLLSCDRGIPLRASVARGVVVSSELAQQPWLGEGVRVLLRGLRLIGFGLAEGVPGLELLAQAPGVWVGEKR